MSLSPDELAAGQRLALYNSRSVGANNPLGLGQGGQRNFIQAADDLSVFGGAILREASMLLAEAERVAGEAQIAAVIVQGGPVSSVNGQTGAVMIDLSEIAEDVGEQLAAVQAAQAALVAAQAGLLDDAITYNRAYGG